MILFQKTDPIKRDYAQKGSMLIFSSFVLLSIAILCIAYFQMIRLNTRMIKIREQGVRAFYAARGGVEDAMYEIKDFKSANRFTTTNNWHSLGGGRYYKSNTASPNTLTNFDPDEYCVTITIAVVGNPDAGTTFNIVSTGNVGGAEYAATRVLEAEAIKTVFGEITIIKVEEL